MSLEIRTSATDEYLMLKVSGLYNLTEVKSLIFLMREKGAEFGHIRVLADLRGVEQDVPGYDRFILCEYYAKEIRYTLKTAVVGPPERITGFFEDVAVNRGGNVRVFSDEQSALRWLKE
jgi:SpoIIAA-like